MTTPTPAPREAKAADRPCELHRYHHPRPSRTEGHHRHPVYLQNRLYGRIRDNELLWLCGTCHDNVHEWLGWLLGESRKPDPEPTKRAKDEAARSLAWYLSEKETQ